MPATAVSHKQVLNELKSLGTTQNRKVYARHGVGPNMYGVSYANLNKLAKRIKKDQDVAEALWATGNHDARVLATMVADSSRMTVSQVDAWARDLGNYPLTDAFAGLASRTGFARTSIKKWTRSTSEWIGQAGWLVLSHLAMHDDAFTDKELGDYLTLIEREIHGRKNRVRAAMKSALIAIGIRNRALERKALAAAKRIGKVEVDHGETGCKTPDAAAYIRKAAERKKKKKS